MKKGVSNRLRLLFIMLGTLAMLAGCGDDDQVGELLHSADVRCEISKVWAGPGGASPLPQLTDCGSGLANNWHNLPSGGWVTTDDSGEAWIHIDGCLIIYLFAHNGELRKAACSEGSGGITCSFSGTSVYNNQCSSEIIIQTPSAQLVLEGTWLSVTYLPEMQLTLIMVFEGAVDVQPVLNFEEYTLGDTIQVEEGAFLFTAPGDEPPVIADLPGREAIPFEQLPPVIGELTSREPNLERWLDRIRVRAEEDDVSFPDIDRASPTATPPSEVEGLFLVGGGDLWEDELVQDAILHAVDWAPLTERMFGQSVPVVVKQVDPSGQSFGVHPDARAVEYDPGRAQELLDEAGLVDSDGDGVREKEDGAPLSLAILTTAGMADWMVGDMDAVGIHVEVILVSTDDAYTQMNEMIAAGESVLWLSARFSDIGRVSPTPTPPPPPTPTPDNQGPPAPSLVSPTGGEMLECGSVTLDWNAVSDPSGIDTYYVKVETVTGIFKSEEWETTDTQFTIPAAWVECGFEHRWAVRAEDGAGNMGPWSDWTDFAPTIG